MRKFFQLLLLNSLFIVCFTVDAKEGVLDSGSDKSIPNSKILDTTTKETSAADKFKKLEVNKEDLDTKTIIFDFPNSELKIFSQFVAQLCGKILIGEHFLEGNINIQSQKSMNLHEVRRIFDALLSTNGLEYIETEECMEIIQIAASYVKVYTVKYLKSSDLAKALSQMFRMSFKVGSNPTTVQITEVEGANAIMVLAPKNQHIEIEKAINKLDVIIPQILLDVLIIEVTRSENLAFAANASVNSGPFKVGGDTGVFPGKLTSSNINFEYAKDDWNISVEASDQKSKINILSQPRIIAVANQKSQIIVNQKQPFANGSTTQNTGSTNPSQSTTTTTEEVGLDLTITPRINIDKDITLELELKITNISGNTSMPLGTGNDAQTQSVPIIGHRNITNTSVVENGKTLIIGGLLENIKTQTTIAPPVIGSIPYIGFMFTNTTDVTSQTELMIYITPTVIENTEQLRNITKSEMSKLENYDIKNKETIKQMLTGKKGEADDTFNVFDYFSNKKYRKEQHFIPQP